MAGMESAEIFAQLSFNGTVVYYTRAWNLDSTFSKLSELGSWKDELQMARYYVKLGSRNLSTRKLHGLIHQKEDNSAYLSVSKALYVLPTRKLKMVQ
ncbi:hypothetical protein O9929_14620 [Vibrio lentus]|nr:hypothetical protein [Vibrio lentus]